MANCGGDYSYKGETNYFYNSDNQEKKKFSPKPQRRANFIQNAVATLRNITGRPASPKSRPVPLANRGQQNKIPFSFTAKNPAAPVYSSKQTPNNETIGHEEFQRRREVFDNYVYHGAEEIRQSKRLGLTNRSISQEQVTSPPPLPPRPKNPQRPLQPQKFSPLTPKTAATPKRAANTPPLPPRTVQRPLSPEPQPKTAAPTPQPEPLRRPQRPLPVPPVKTTKTPKPQSPTTNRTPNEISPRKAEMIKQHAFICGDHCFGHEVIERDDDLILQLEFIKAHLAELLKESDIEQRRDTIAFNQQQMRNLLTKYHTDINDPERAHKATVKDTVEDRARLRDNPTEFDSIFENYYVAMAVNLVIHRFESTSGRNDVSFVQTGVFTDPANGFTNLNELKEIQQEINSKGSSKILDSRRKELFEKRKKYRNNERLVKAIDYAITELNNVEKTIKKRQRILTHQALPALAKVIQTQQKELENYSEGDHFFWTHESLLDYKNNKIDEETGWAHYEKNEMLDMAEIMHELENRPLIFDLTPGQSPYIDTQGNVHFVRTSEKMPRRLILDPIFTCFSVQLQYNNSGVQRKINIDALPKINRALNQRQKHINRLLISSSTPQQSQMLMRERTRLNKNRAHIGYLLTQKNSSAAIAEDFLVCLTDSKIPASEGCLSAKDRGGAIGGRCILRYLKREVEEESLVQLQNADTYHKFYRHEESKLLDEDRLLAQNISFNLPNFPIPKVGMPHLRGVPNKKRAAALVKLARTQEPKR